MYRTALAVACGLALAAGPAPAAETAPLVLKLVVKKESYPWPYEQGPKEFEARLQALLKKKKGDERLPNPLAVDLVLQITNTGTEKTTVYVDGDPNVYTLTVKGPGVVSADPGLAFTTDLRLPKAVELGPGKTHEVPVKMLADGFRHMTRYIYTTAPGEYTVSATYQLSTREGGKGPVLKSGEASLKVEEPR